jgi:hypothetical protein
MRADKKIIYALGVALIAGIAAAILLFSKGGGAERSQKSETKAEVVLEKFYSALKTGDFETAKTLCDTVSMHDYLNEYMQNWEQQSQKDSAEFAAIVSTLANTKMTIEKVEEMDGVCIIDYTLSLENLTTDRKATAKKEEGEWKVAKITDAV